MSLPTIFSTCKLRADVEAGSLRDDEFMARGVKDLLKAVCPRLSGKGGEVSSIIRLGTQYGGGKTQGLIAHVHAVRGASQDSAGVPNLSDFVEPSILPLTFEPNEDVEDE